MTRAATNSSGSFRRRGFDRPILLLAALCVALMPSIFKGGGELAHPHSFFQFWLSGPESAFGHHHEETGAASERAHEHSSAQHSQLSHAPTIGSVDAALPATERYPDVPTVTPATAPGGIVSMLIVVGLIAATMASPYIASWRYSIWRPSFASCLFAPEPPPPEVLSRFDRHESGNWSAGLRSVPA